MATVKKSAKKSPAKKATAKPAAKAAAVKVIKTKPAAVALPEPSGVYAEWLKAIGMKHDPALAFSAVAVKICEEAAKLPDEDFNKRSAAAQKWFNDAGDVINKGEKAYGDIPALDGFPTAAPAAAADGAAPAKPGKAAKAAKPAAVKAEKKPRVQPDGVADKVRRAVVTEGPDADFETVMKSAGVKGAEHGGHAWNVFFNTRQAIRTANDMKAYRQPARAAA